MYRNVLVLLYNCFLEPFHENGNICKDLVGTDECMASVAHVTEVNKETMVDTKKISSITSCLVSTATQHKNLPLPLCNYIVPLAASYWNRLKPGTYTCRCLGRALCYAIPRPAGDSFCYNAQLSYKIRHQPKTWVSLPLGHKTGLLRSPRPILGWMSPF